MRRQWLRLLIISIDQAGEVGLRRRHTTLSEHSHTSSHAALDLLQSETEDLRDARLDDARQLPRRRS